MITEQTMYKTQDGGIHETKTEALLHHIGIVLTDERYEHPMEILCFLEDLSDNPALLKPVTELIKEITNPGID